MDGRRESQIARRGKIEKEAKRHGSMGYSSPMRATARPQRIPGQMNKTEQRYAMHLEVRKRAGEIVKFGYESIKLILAPNTSYTPDFYVVCADGSMEFHEVKGFWEDDSRVKFKVAADKYPE